MATQKTTEVPDSNNEKTSNDEILVKLNEVIELNEKLLAENEKLKVDAEKQKQEQSTEEPSFDPVMQAAIDRMSEQVPVKLFKDNGKYKDDLVVQLAGVAYQIKRGVTVMVPRAVYDIIRRSELQDERTANMLDKLQQEYAEKNK